MANLTTKEFALIENLERHQSQRGLAEASGFSLGMTNLLLKRLVKKGYVKVVSLNGRALRYMLTPTGFAEKVKRSYEFLVVSIRQLNEVKTKIRDVVMAESGGRMVWVMGQNELAGLTKEVLRDNGIPYESLLPGMSKAEYAALAEGAVILLCEPDDRAADYTVGGIHIVELPSRVG